MKRAILIVALGATALGPGSGVADPVQADPSPTRVEAAARRTPPAKPRARPRLATVVRYAGGESWSLADAPVVAEFFERRFGRPLPVSAWGQTPIHDRLRLDHHNAFDVAVHPDSPEGRALLAFLRGEGIPFVAVRARMRGASTGAHIHVGPESERLAPLPRATTLAKVKRARVLLVSGRDRSVPDDRVLDGSVIKAHAADEASGPPDL